MLSKNGILNSINRNILSFGFKIERKSKSNAEHTLPVTTTHADFVRFYSSFFDIQNVFDVGAHKGWWTKEVQWILPKAHFFLFDPVKHELPGINMNRVRVFNCLLSNNEREVKFYTKAETGDSYLKEQSNTYSLDEIKMMHTVTLDGISIQENLPYPDLIKLDTQGSELDIIDGGLHLIEECSFIICEVPINSYNHNAPNLTQYLEKLESLGFVPAHILEGHKSNGKLIQIDFAFVKSKLL
jgi:FkbM family methyltransferase